MTRSNEGTGTAFLIAGVTLTVTLLITDGTSQQSRSGEGWFRGAVLLSASLIAVGGYLLARSLVHKRRVSRIESGIGKLIVSGRSLYGTIEVQKSPSDRDVVGFVAATKEWRSEVELYLRSNTPDFVDRFLSPFPRSVMTVTNPGRPQCLASLKEWLDRLAGLQDDLRR